MEDMFVNKLSKLLILVPLAVLAGCDTKPVNVNFNFSNVGGFGTHNTGLYNPGSLFIWNTETNDFRFLESLTLTPTGTVNYPGNIVSRSVAGMEVSGIPASLSGSEGLVEASISGQTEYILNGASRTDYKNTITKISEYVRKLISEGQDPDHLFKPRNDNYKLVIIRSVLKAKSSSLSIGGTDASDPSKIVDVALKTPIGDIASVKVKAGSSITCGSSDNTTGTPPACFFNVLVLDPHYDENKTAMQFRLENKPANASITDAFRSL